MLRRRAFSSFTMSGSACLFPSVSKSSKTFCLCSTVHEADLLFMYILKHVYACTHELIRYTTIESTYLYILTHQYHLS